MGGCEWMGLDDIAIFGIYLVFYHIYTNGTKTIGLIITVWVDTWIAKRNKKRENAEQSQAALLNSSCVLKALLLGFTLRHSALNSVVGLYLSSLGSTLCRWALPFVVRHYHSSFGTTLRRWALPFVVRHYHLSFGTTLRRWALPFVVGVRPSLLGSALCRWVVPFVFGLYCSSSSLGFGPSSLGFTLSSSVLHLQVVGSSFSDVGGWHCVGFDVISVGWGIGECMVETNHDDNRRGSFCVTYYMGLPSPGSPLMLSVPDSAVEQIWATHIPLEREGRPCLHPRFWELTNCFFSPHPSIEGRGS